MRAAIRPGRRLRWPEIAVAAAIVALQAAAAPAQQEPSAVLAEAKTLLESGLTEEAGALLDRLLARRPDEAEALLLRSTIRFVQGEMEKGRGDLERALAVDPSLRQGWLNLAALDLSNERFDEALAALERARQLDPEAPDNDLNIGAVLLLTGRLDEANRSFRRYLDRDPDSAEAHYLVASNYAMAGYSALSIRLLEGAIALDEKMRMRARTDSNFGDLEAEPQFQRLLLADSYRPPPGAHRAARRFPSPYVGADSGLLAAVIDALQLSGEPFDPRIEATPDWALIWSDVRIKVTPASEGEGEVALSAPADRFRPDQWQEKTDRLFRQIAIQVATRRP